MSEINHTEYNKMKFNHTGTEWLILFFVLFCFVLFCFVLFCFVLFCFVLFCFVLFCFVLFCFVLGTNSSQTMCGNLWANQFNEHNW